MKRKPKIDCLLEGIAIIRKYEESPDIAAEHDVVFCGSYETSEKMTDEERATMRYLGWFEEYDSWAISV